MAGKKLRGTIATTVDTKGKAETYPLTVLKTYLNWGETPLKWGDARAAELAQSIQWALSRVPKKLLTLQERFEENAKTKF